MEPSAPRSSLEFRNQKLLLARGAPGSATGPPLQTLVLLADDEDEEVRVAARETLQRLPDTDYARWLEGPSLSETVARYFLDPAHLRPAMIPALLGNPVSPQAAILALVAQAGPDLLPALLEHLDLLKTDALVALKKNPAYLASQKEPAAPSFEVTAENKWAVARGGVSIPAAERLPILVALASDVDGEIRQAAQETLARIPDEECAEQLVEASLAESVARYFLDPARVRLPVLPILLANPKAPQDAVIELARQAGPLLIPVLLDNIDLLKTSALIALKDNPAYLDWQREPPTEGVVLEVDLLEMLIAEAEAEEARAAESVPPAEAEEEVAAGKKEGLTGKLARMSVAQKVKAALLGNREERAMLIHDGSRVVTRAVLASPKLSDVEVEGFAAMKNVDQDVLRNISMNRKFMKNYSVMKNLINNPRLPIDLGLPLIPRLIQTDLQLLVRNRDVSDVIRKMADKLAKTRRQ